MNKTTKIKISKLYLIFINKNKNNNSHLFRKIKIVITI